MNGRDKYAARLAKARRKVQAEKAKKKGAAKQSFTESHLELHKHARDNGSGPYEKFTWKKEDVLEARDGTKFSLRKELHKCAFYQEILCHIVGKEVNGKPKKAIVKVINVVPERIYPEGRKVDEEEIVSLISSAGDSPALAQSLCIFMHECFHVLAFEPYSVDLTSYLGDDPTEVRYLRFILRQVLDGLRCLERLGIVHGDLRGANIRLLRKDHIRVRINITGFQFAQFTSDIVQGSIMQTASTRAPEVIVGGEITEAIDMWSLACTFSYQNTVEDAFQGETPLHMLWSIVEQQGRLPDWLLESGLYTDQYFEQKKGKWQLKRIDDPVYIAEHTPDAAHYNYGEAHELDESMFWELIGQMMDVDPRKRITPAKALEHPFITMSYLNLGVSAIKYSKYAKMCAELVDPALPFSHYYIRKIAEDFPSEALSSAKKKKNTKRKKESSSDDDSI